MDTEVLREKVRAGKYIISFTHTGKMRLSGTCLASLSDTLEPGMS